MPYYRRRRNYPSRRQPYRKRNNQYYKKRTYNKKRKFDKPYTIKSRLPTGVPDRMMCKLKYSQFVSLTPGLGDDDVLYNFRGNSIFDPDAVGTGEQPLGHDEWAAFYNRYRVYASKCTVQFLAQSDVTTNLVYTLMPTIPQLATALDPIDIIQHPYSKYKIQGIPEGGASKVILSGYMSTKKLYGEKSLAEDDYTALMSSNPAAQWFWNIGMQTMDGSINPGTCDLLVTVVYYVEMFERVQLSSS